jgi:two-component system, NtrC family, nitrogen regulation sensor histidine kinase NtrY
MDYRKFNLQIIVRVIIIVILAIITAYGIIDRGWFFTPLVSGILLLLSCIELVRHLSYYHRSLNNFLMTIKQSGFNASFPENKPREEELFHTFNEIIQSFQSLALENEAQLQFLNTLTDNIQAGILVFNEAGVINWMNPEVKNLIRKPGISSLTDLARIQPDLAGELKALAPGRKKIISMPGSGENMEVSVQVSKILIGGEILNIGLLQNIHREMEIKEVEAWQKLTRVMRHEIMNSMTPIVGLTEAVNLVISSKENLNISDPDFIDIKESLHTIEDRSKGLLKFVNAYKDFSQVPELSLSEIGINDLLEKVKALFEKELAQKTAVLHLDVKPASMKVLVDQELFEQVFINLVKNSLEAFENSSGEIVVFCRRDKDRSLIRFSDNGSGIEEQILDRIFIPFYTTKKEGSGIGLSLSRQIIQQHGGNITVSSAKGKGTTFVIEI